MSEQWKESVYVHINKEGDKTDCSTYRGTSLLSVVYKILCTILSSLTHVDEINLLAPELFF